MKIYQNYYKYDLITYFLYIFIVIKTKKFILIAKI